MPTTVSESGTRRATTDPTPIRGRVFTSPLATDLAASTVQALLDAALATDDADALWVQRLDAGGRAAVIAGAPRHLDPTDAPFDASARSESGGPGRPVVVSLSDRAIDNPARATLRRLGTAALLALPLPVAARDGAMLHVASRNARAFDGDRIDQWVALGDQIRRALTRQTATGRTARQREAATGTQALALAIAQAERQSILRQASEIMSRTVDRRTAFRQISELGLRLPGVERCGIQIWDEATGLVEVGFEVTIPEWPGVAEAGTKMAPGDAWPFPLLLDDPRPVHHWVDDLSLDAQGAGYLDAAGLGSLLECPMVADGQLLGSLGFYARTRAPFSGATRELAAELATQTALVVRKMIGGDLSAKISDERAMLLRVSTAANSSLDLDTVLAEIAAASVGVAGAERCRVDLLTDDGRHLVVAAQASVPDWMFPPDDGVGQRLPIGEWSIDERVVSSRVPFVVDGPDDPQVVGQMRVDLDRAGTQALLIAPLWIDDAFIGVVSTFSRRRGAFGGDELTLMGEVAQRVTVAIQNARRLHAERVRADQQTALYRVSRAATSSLDLYPILHEVCVACLGIDGAESTEVQLYDARTHDFEVAALAAHPGHEHTVAPGARFGFGYWAHIDPLITSQREPIIVVGADDPLVCASLRRKMTQDRIGSLLVIPLWHVDTCLGALVLFSSRTAAFPTEHLNLAGQIAQQASIAVQNARLLERERNLAKHRGALLRISAAAASSLDLTTILNQVAAELKAVTGVAAVTVELWRPELDACEVALCLADPGPVQAPAVGTRFPDRDEAPAHSRRAGSIVRAPLWAGEQSLGAIVLYDGRAQRLDAAMSELLEEASGHIALAIANARLIETERRRSLERAVLVEIGRSATTDLPLDEKLRLISRACLAIPEVECASVTKFLPERRVAIVVADVSVDDWGDDDPPGTLHHLADRPTCAAWLATGEPIIHDIDDPHCPPDVRAEIVAFGGQTSLWVGLRVGDEIFGNFSLHSRRRGTFTPATVAIAKEIAGQVSLTIRNGRLIEAERRRSLERSVLLEVGNAATSDLPLTDKLRRIAEACLTIPEVEGATISNYLPERGIAVTVADVAIADWPGVDEPGTTYDLRDTPWLADWLIHGRPRVHDVDDPEIPAEMLAEIVGFGGQASIWVGLRIADETFGGLGFHTRARDTLNDATIAIAAEIAAQISLTIRNARLLAETQRHANEQAALLRVSRAVTTVTPETLADSLQQIAALSMNVVDADLCEILLWRRDLDATELVAQVHSPAWRGDLEPLNIVHPLAGRTTALDVLHERRAVLMRPETPTYTASEHARLWSDGTRSGLAAPLVFGDRAIGLIGYYTDRADAFDEHHASLAVDLGAQTALAIERANTLAALAEQATTDGLTGLLNHRAIRDRLDAELLRAQRREEMVAVCMVDLNRFKQINDSHGHLVGDQVLQQTAAILNAATRQTDIVGRYGGDEFLVILPDTDAVEAVVVAGRMLEQAAKVMIPLPAGGHLSPSLSIGFAVYPTDARSRPELVETADRAMYDAKARTRRPLAHGTGSLRPSVVTG